MAKREDFARQLMKLIKYDKKEARTENTDLYENVTGVASKLDKKVCTSFEAQPLGVGVTQSYPLDHDSTAWNDAERLLNPATSLKARSSTVEWCSHDVEVTQSRKWAEVGGKKEKRRSRTTTRSHDVESSTKTWRRGRASKRSASRSKRVPQSKVIRRNVR